MPFSIPTVSSRLGATGWVNSRRMAFPRRAFSWPTLAGRARDRWDIGGRGPLRLNFHADFQAGPEHSVAVVDLGDDPAGLGFRIDLAVDEDDVTQERLVLDRGAGTLGQDPDALPRSGAPGIP